MKRRRNCAGWSSVTRLRLQSPFTGLHSNTTLCHFSTPALICLLHLKPVSALSVMEEGWSPHHRRPSGRSGALLQITGHLPNEKQDLRRANNPVSPPVTSHCLPIKRKRRGVGVPLGGKHNLQLAGKTGLTRGQPSAGAQISKTPTAPAKSGRNLGAKLTDKPLSILSKPTPLF
ncbi:hypothetical protein AAFF_G00048360 [Aldrovandia affinis]|uniref:Uncharacterized protein n=1 Tax=Aldrovandia affinis TaxID=143900 RepID=A0AAD7S1K3_9TELE|nr:hypothetical protein AAFF_G00048360 [Aldrovandia affinis]